MPPKARQLMFFGREGGKNQREEDSLVTDGHTDPAEQLGDFTTTTRMLPAGLLAIAIESSAPS